MSPAEIFFVGGMSAITLAFPTLLVVMWALDRAHAARLVPAQAEAHAEPPALRRAA